MEEQGLTRGSGILLAISSLPSPHGIGTLGNAAFRFIDLLVDLKQKYWQVLPVGPTSYGDSPYQALSAFAGNPYLVDLDFLVEEGLLSSDEIKCYNWGTNESSVDYAVLFENRYKVLKTAFYRFDKNSQSFLDFKEQNKEWLGDYALFMAIKRMNNDRNWQEWPAELRDRQPVALEKCRKDLYNEISFWEFCQYKFYEQWQGMKEYAELRGIKIIGDVSFFVGYDSADVWAHPELFMLDEEKNPIYVAAAIADKYSENGQVWGNPVYDWNKMEEDGFAWWKDRIKQRKLLFDVIRIDHFTGMVKNYVVPYKATTTVNGKWIKAPGKHLTDALNTVLGEAAVIADDYGGKSPIPGVKKLLSKTGWLGTKVLMFAFDGNTANEHLPHNYVDHRIAVYAGTHDNETIVGHFRGKTDYECAYLYEYLNIDKKEQVPDGLIRNAYQSIADLAIIQMQDLLKLGNEARMNAPSTIGNWRWRLAQEQLDETRRAWIRNLAAVYRR